MAITVCKFLPPPDPLEPFLFLDLLQSNSAWKISKCGVFPPPKDSQYAPDVKHFQRAYLRPFPGLNT